jgi:hypothetical protein
MKIKAIIKKEYEVDGKTYSTLEDAKNAQIELEYSMRLEVVRDLLKDAMQTDLTLEKWLQVQGTTLVQSIKFYKKTVSAKAKKLDANQINMPKKAKKKFAIRPVDLATKN